MFTTKSYKRAETYFKNMGGSRLIIPFMATSADIILSLRSRRFEFVWINDSDAAVASLWRAILVYPRKLIKKIEKCQPHPYDQAYFAAELGSLTRIPADVETITDVALKKLALLDEWNPAVLTRYVRSASTILKKQSCRFTSWDFETLLQDGTDDDLIYMDSPNLSKPDMWRLSECLYGKQNWLLITADADFYGWANIEQGHREFIIRPYSY